MSRRRKRPVAATPAVRTGPPLGRRPLVWLVALASTVEAAGQAVDAALGGRPTSVVVWVTIALLVFSFALSIESLKVFQEQ